jgi:hypothetical protein
MCCALLTGQRRLFFDEVRRNLVGAAASLHRKTYMSERLQYYHNIQEARKYPDTIFSINADGMSQNSNAMPSLENQKDFNFPLRCHNQGILEHGKLFVS